MDDLSRQYLNVPLTSEKDFQQEEAELRRWLDENVTDSGIRKQHLERLREDHAARGRRFF